MDIAVKGTADTLYIYLSGELDEYNAPAVRARVDRELDAHAGVGRVVIDLAEVRFMDSTAIGFLIGRYKKLKNFGIPVFIAGASNGVEKVIELSGLYHIMPKY